MTEPADRARWACPGCGTGIAEPVAACATCGLRFVGPDADRLRVVLAERAALDAEAAALIRRLQAPVAAPPTEPVPAGAASVASAASATPVPPVLTWATPAPLSTTAPTPAPRRGLGVQQVLYGLGALLLLAGSSVFVLAVWFIVGLPGQIVLMLGFTLAAFGAARAAARRPLPGASETAGCLGLGLLAIDLWAAYGLGLAGVDRWESSTYLAAAAAVVAVIAVGLHLAALRERGATLRPVVVYLPAAVAAHAVAWWAVISRIDPDGLTAALCVGAGAGVLTLPAIALLRLRPSLAPVDHPVVDEPPARLRALAAAHGSARVLAVGAGGIAALVWLVVDLELAYDLDGAERSSRYPAGALLVLVALAGWLLLRRRAAASSIGLLAAGASAVGAIGLGAGAVDVPRTAWTLVAVGAAVVSAALVARSRGADPSPPTQVVFGGVHLLVPSAAVLALVLSGAGARSVTALARGGASNGPLDTGWLILAWIAVLATASVLALAAPLTASVLGAAAIGPTLLVLDLIVALQALDGAPGEWGLIAGSVVALAVAVSAAHRGAGVRGRHRSVALALEAGAAIAVLLLAAASLAATHGDDATREAVAWTALGLGGMVWAGAPRRFGLAWPAAAALSAATWTVSHDRGITLLEAYTLPLAVLLLAIGLAQQSRRRRAGLPPAATMLSQAPALGVGLLPSALLAISGGDAVRTAAVTVVAAAFVALGAARLVRAPFVVGTIALVLLAITQGGPYLGVLPAWLTLSCAGAALLALAVGWEHAVASGRRTTAWFSQLR